MDLKCVTFVTFSPTGSTARVIKALAKQCPTPVSMLDITAPQDACRRRFSSQDLLVIGYPVFGGRIPQVIRNRLAYIQGSDTPAVVVATYGNRNYDDALLEMADFLTDHGFIPMAGAAMVTQHSIVPSVASGRPDADDFTALANFSRHLYKCIKLHDSTKVFKSITLPGNAEYKAIKPNTIKPQTNKNCVACGRCVKGCPMGAIPVDNPSSTLKDRCITCMACIAHCPNHAREISRVELLVLKQFLAKSAKKDKNPLFFLPIDGI